MDIQSQTNITSKKMSHIQHNIVPHWILAIIITAQHTSDTIVHVGRGHETWFIQSAANCCEMCANCCRGIWCNIYYKGCSLTCGWWFCSRLLLLLLFKLQYGTSDRNNTYTPHLLVPSDSSTGIFHLWLVLRSSQAPTHQHLVVMMRQTLTKVWSPHSAC